MCVYVAKPVAVELRCHATALIELFPFVILNNAMAFVYAYMQCLDGQVIDF